MLHVAGLEELAALCSVTEDTELDVVDDDVVVATELEVVHHVLDELEVVVATELDVVHHVLDELVVATDELVVETDEEEDDVVATELEDEEEVAQIGLNHCCRNVEMDGMPMPEKPDDEYDDAFVMVLDG